MARGEAHGTHIGHLLPTGAIAPSLNPTPLAIEGLKAAEGAVVAISGLKDSVDPIGAREVNLFFLDGLALMAQQTF